MSNSAGETNHAARIRTRAKQACTSCHSRRIRCNVIEAHPCFNCLSIGNTCEVAPSKRGRHKRRPRPNPAAPPEVSQRDETPVLESGPEVNTQDASSFPRVANYPQTPQTACPPILQDTSPPQQAAVAPSPISDAGTKTWNLIHGGMYFGESNALNSVASDDHDSTLQPCSSRRTPRYYAVPIEPVPEGSRDHDVGGVWALKERILQEQGALDMPSQQQYTPILQAYFRWFHPCFPILDKVEFSKVYTKDIISPLLLNAMLFVGVTYSEEVAVQNLGYTNLGEAKRQLYTKAKLLFEADWETNRLTILQALFLLTFLRVPMSTVKGHRYWLSAAINLAHLHGLHRASPQASATPTSDVSAQTKVRRRIWWSLYVRDIHSSTSLGLPARVRDEDSDVPMLSPSDLMDSETPCVEWLADPPTMEQITYVTNMPRLMSLLDRIAQCFFAPKPSPNERLASREDFMEAIETWKTGLPPSMQVIDAYGETPNIWTSLLHLAYNHLIMLLYREDLINQQPDGQKGLHAACRATQVAEGLLANGMVKYSQLYLITSVFAALCIHTTQLQQSQGVPRRLGENRARLCLLCLKEAQKSWDINNDILDLFFKHVEARLAVEFQKEVADYSSGTSEAMPTRGLNDGASLAMVETPVSLLPGTAIPDITRNGKEAADSGHEVMQDMETTLDVSNSFADDFLTLLGPGLDFSVGEAMGMREFDTLQRWF